MLKVAIVLLLLVGFCKSDAVGPRKEVQGPKDSCKAFCPSLPHFSHCEYKCANNQSVLNCRDHDFTSISDAELEQWETSLKNCKMELYFLRLESNSIDRLTPIPNLPGLQLLNLKRNKMTEIEPKAFLNLPNLKSLDLSQNFLTGEAVRPDIFTGPPKTDQYEPLAIEVLDLSSNKIHSLNSKTFEHLPNLRVLYLHGNPLKVDEHTITAITAAPLLEVLSLSDCMLDKISFPKASNLKELFLNNNNFTAVPEELPANLTYLNLNGNLITTIPTCAFCHVPKLQEVSISEMLNLTTIESEAFRGLPALKTLSCAYNPKLEEIHPAAFISTGHKWTLTTVSFANCSLKILPRALLAWSQVATLNLRGNPLSCNLDDWSPDAVTLLKKSETALGLLAEHQSCNAWNLQASRHSAAVGMVVQTALIAASAAISLMLGFILVVFAVRKAQSELNTSSHLMVHYRRTTPNAYP